MTSAASDLGLHCLPMSQKWEARLILINIQGIEYGLIYQALNGMAPEYIQKLFRKSSEIHHRNLRTVENDMLRIPHSRTYYYERSFAIDGAKQWNQLPLDIKHAPSLSTFKTSIKPHFLVVQ